MRGTGTSTLRTSGKKEIDYLTTVPTPQNNLTSTSTFPIPASNTPTSDAKKLEFSTSALGDIFCEAANRTRRGTVNAAFSCREIKGSALSQRQLHERWGATVPPSVMQTHVCALCKPVARLQARGEIVNNALSEIPPCERSGHQGHCECCRKHHQRSVGLFEKIRPRWRKGLRRFLFDLHV